MSFHIAVLPGDGIGVEVTGEALTVLRHLARIDNTLSLDFEMLEGGADLYQRTGVAMPESSALQAEKAHAILLGAMGLPHVRYPDGREVSPQIDLRENLGLYAGVRPVRTIPGLAPVLADPRAADTRFRPHSRIDRRPFFRASEGRHYRQPDSNRHSKD